MQERQCSQILEEDLRKELAEEDNGYSKGAFLEVHQDAQRWDLGGNLRIKPKAINLVKQNYTEEVNSPFSHPRRSFSHMRLNSSMFPTYMAVTESTKAKMRSMSTPRQRLRYIDSSFESTSNNSSWFSYNGESSALGRTPHCS